MIPCYTKPQRYIIVIVSISPISHDYSSSLRLGLFFVVTTQRNHGLHVMSSLGKNQKTEYKFLESIWIISYFIFANLSILFEREKKKSIYHEIVIVNLDFFLKKNQNCLFTIAILRYHHHHQLLWHDVRYRHQRQHLASRKPRVHRV